MPIGVTNAKIEVIWFYDTGIQNSSITKLISKKYKVWMKEAPLRNDSIYNSGRSGNSGIVYDRQGVLAIQVILTDKLPKHPVTGGKLRITPNNAFIIYDNKNFRISNAIGAGIQKNMFPVPYLKIEAQESKEFDDLITP
jgi:hypothetical protein